MRRYLILSIALHALVVALFYLKEELVIEDPIEAVQIDFDQKPDQKKQGQSRPKAHQQVQAATSTSQNEPKPEAPATSDSSFNENGLSGAYETGTVTKKPRVLKQVQIFYPESAKQARIEGPVRLSVTIDESGLVKDVRVLEGPGYGLNEAAQEALKQFVFSPAELEGKKVSVRITYVYRFKLESR
jgi:TonB family protein